MVITGDIYKCPSGSTTFTGVGGTNYNWSSICSDPSGNIWAAVSGGPIYECLSGSTTFNAVNTTSKAWNSICSDSSGNIWAVVYGGGDIYFGKYQQNQITALTMGAIPQNLRATLVELICRIKPIHTWAALMVNFT